MKETEVRMPAVAGQFYPATKEELRRNIQALTQGAALTKKNIIACMLPHAGYMYSGQVAGQTVCSFNIKEKIIMLGPNHTGYGKEFSIMSQGKWQTPLGEVKIDSNLAKQILGNSRYLKEDSLAHAYEHSLEVELPFLQYFKSDFEIVPITVLSNDVNALKQVGRDIAAAIQSSGFQDKIMLVASSDMTHYEAQPEAEKKDKAAIQAITDLNEDKLIEKVESLNISMCGYAPVVSMLVAAKILGAKCAELIKYQTSGDVTGDKSSVVGYAGMIIY